jgi:DNA gyrase/topoisomerase IV subunit B
VRESYVNLIPTSAGGTHESACGRPVRRVKGFIELHSLLPKGVKLMPEDVFSRASFVLSAKVLDPQFQGQIKERLNSRDALRLVSSSCARRWSCGSTSMSSIRQEAGRAGDPRRRRRASAPARRSRSARARAWPCCRAS